MVYDDSKNLIGDLHYRASSELQEGEELRLDKGVLVDVGRRTGQTETDLAEVLEKGRHGDEATQTKQATPAAMYHNIQRGPHLDYQGRPKSLAAVLGASQGHIGRARLATKSPYEQLHSTRPDAMHEQPPAKRQRIAMEKENAPSLSKAARTEQQAGVRPQPFFSPSLSRAPLSERPEVNSSKTVINISSDDENHVSPVSSRAFGSGRGRQKGRKAMRNPPAKLDLTPKPLKLPLKALPRLLSVIDQSSVPSNVHQKQVAIEQAFLRDRTAEAPAQAQPKRKAPGKSAAVKKPAEVLAAASKTQSAPAKPAVAARKPTISEIAKGKQKRSVVLASPTVSARISLGPTSILRFAPHKSRPKLMYKALLPSSFVADQPVSSNSKSAASTNSAPLMKSVTEPGYTTPRKPRSGIQPEENMLDLISPESIRDQCQKNRTTTQSRLRCESLPSQCQGTSPLFCTQSPNAVTPDIVVIEDNSPVPSPMKTPLPNLRTDPEHSADVEPLEDSQTPVHEPELASEPFSVSKLTLMDQRLMMPPPRIEPPSSQMEKPATHGQQSSYQTQRLSTNIPSEVQQPRPFRRVLSESDSPARATGMPTIPPPTGKVPSALTGMQHRSSVKPVAPGKPFKSPAKLQRSYSDTAAMLQVEMQRPIGKLSLNVPEVVGEEVDTDVGPWSTREAFLLFDWWPPGREKPDYGCTIEPRIQEQSFGGFTHPRNAAGFGQLHRVIRDGIDI